jgi:hypothetical protein
LKAGFHPTVSLANSKRGLVVAAAVFKGGRGPRGRGGKKVAFDKAGYMHFVTVFFWTTEVGQPTIFVCRD